MKNIKVGIDVNDFPDCLLNPMEMVIESKLRAIENQILICHLQPISSALQPTSCTFFTSDSRLSNRTSSNLEFWINFTSTQLTATFELPQGLQARRRSRKEKEENSVVIVFTPEMLCCLAPPLCMRGRQWRSQRDTRRDVGTAKESESGGGKRNATCSRNIEGSTGRCIKDLAERQLTTISISCRVHRVVVCFSDLTWRHLSPRTRLVNREDLFGRFIRKPLVNIQ